MAADAFEPVGLFLGGYAGTVLPVVRDVVEHVRHARPLPGMRPPVEMDLVSQLQRVVAARRLVRASFSLKRRSRRTKSSRAATSVCQKCNLPGVDPRHSGERLALQTRTRSVEDCARIRSRLED